MAQQSLDEAFLAPPAPSPADELTKRRKRSKRRKTADQEPEGDLASPRSMMRVCSGPFLPDMSPIQENSQAILDVDVSAPSGQLSFDASQPVSPSLSLLQTSESLLAIPMGQSMVSALPAALNTSPHMNVDLEDTQDVQPVPSFQIT